MCLRNLELLLIRIGSDIFGDIDGRFYALIPFVVIDYITGVCVAIRNKQIASNIGAHGIARKISMFALVSLSCMIDRFLIGKGDVLRTVTIIFYLSNEAMSIFENVGRIGLPLPSKLKNFLENFQKYDPK